MVELYEGAAFSRTVQATEGDDSDPGLASRRDCVLTATPENEGTLEPAWVLHQREGTSKTPRCVKGKGPKDPGVAAPLAAAGFRGNRSLNASCVALLDRPFEDMVC